MTQAARFRELMRRDGMVVAPGAYDCITARLIERAGYDAVYMTGAGTAATLGYPDFGLVTMSEMVDNARRIATAVGVPVIADADTGYGNELNVVRTVREYEAAGVAGIHIEDQGFPKKCGHLDDKEIVPRADWLAKIRAAAASRRSRDFTVIARTDARAVAGFDEAIGARQRRDRGRRRHGVCRGAADPGRGRQGAATGARARACLNVVHGGKTPEIDLAEAERMGYKLAIVPGLLIKNVVGICEKMLARTGRDPPPPEAGARDDRARDLPALGRRRMGRAAHPVPGLSRRSDAKAPSPPSGRGSG